MSPTTSTTVDLAQRISSLNSEMTTDFAVLAIFIAACVVLLVMLISDGRRR